MPSGQCLLLVSAVFRDVLLRSFRRKLDGMHLMVGRHMRLIRCCHKIFQLMKLRGFAVVCRAACSWCSAARWWRSLSVDIVIPSRS
jgi:hypothetical protein